MARVLIGSIPVKTLTQTKLLTTNKTTSGNIPDLTFNNLVIGMAYRVRLNLLVNYGTTISQTVKVDCIHNSVNLFACGINTTNTTSSLDPYMNASEVFIATATSVTFDAVITSVGGIIRGANALSQSWAQLEQLPDHVITNNFD